MLDHNEQKERRRAKRELDRAFETVSSKDKVAEAKRLKRLRKLARKLERKAS